MESARVKWGGRRADRGGFWMASTTLNPQPRRTNESVKRRRGSRERFPCGFIFHFRLLFPKSFFPFGLSFCPIAILSSDVCPPHPRTTPSTPPRSLVRLFARLPSFLPWPTRTTLLVGRSVGRSAACSWYHLPPPTTPANAAAAAPTDGPRSTLGCVRAAAAAAYLGKIKDGGHESKHGQRRRRQRGQPSEGGKWRWAAAAAALVGRRCAEGDRGRTSETEGTKEEGRKRKSPHSLQPQSQHLKNRLLCYAKDNNRCDTKDRRRHKRGNNNDFIRSEIGSLEGMETKDGGDS